MCCKNRSEKIPAFLFPAYTPPCFSDPRRGWLTNHFLYSSPNACFSLSLLLWVTMFKLSGCSPIAMTRNSHSSDRGRLVGGTSYILKVKPALSVWTASKQSQEHRLGVGGGLFSANQPDGDAPRGMQQKTKMLPWKPALFVPLTVAWSQCHL